MRPIISILTAVAFLLHMWLGCCAHHAHAGAETAGHDHAAAVCEHDHTGHHHGGTELPSEEPADDDSSCPTAPCSDGECVFLKAGKSELNGPEAAAVLPVAVNDSFAAQVAIPAPVAVDTGGLIAPPVRIHLAHQVWLN